MSATEVKYRIENGENIRLDVYLTAETEYTRSRIKRMIDDGKVLVNGSKCKGGRILKESDEISVFEEEEITVLPVAKEIPVEVLFEDDDIVVVNKQQGLVVHPGAGGIADTLIGGLLWRGSSLAPLGGAERPGVVHRLDKDTSGVMVVAKSDRAYLSLSRQFAERSTKKIYQSILVGNLKDDKGILTTFIGRNPKDRKLMAVTSEGRVAITEYKVLERFKGYCYAEFNLHTGRTHQIRVHAAYLGHPCLGDISYGGVDKRFPHVKGQLLHSKSLTFTHPVSGEKLTFTAQLPKVFEETLERLRRESGGGDEA